MVTKKKLLAFIDVRNTGLTNMYDVNTVVNIAMDIAPGADLNRKDCIDIMQNFEKYEAKYGYKLCNDQ